MAEGTAVSPETEYIGVPMLAVGARRRRISDIASYPRNQKRELFLMFV
jgi:hypothetical protein